MANVNAPFGARPVKHLDGSDWNGKTRRYSIPASDGTAVYIGDIVKAVAGSDAAGLPQCIVAAATDTTLLGAVVSLEPQAARLGDLYRPASIAYIVNVVDDPTVIYEMQEDSVGNNIDDSGNLSGGNADLVAGSGSTVTGRSGMMIDSSGLDADTAQLRVLRLVQSPDNAKGQYARWEVMINEHMYKSTTGVE